MAEYIVSFLSVALVLAGVLAKYLWDYFTKEIENAKKAKEETLKERVETIGGEIKSRLISLELRFTDLETAVYEFKKENQFSLRSQRDGGIKTLDAIKVVISKADEINKHVAARVKVIEDRIEIFEDWLKKNGS